MYYKLQYVCTLIFHYNIHLSVLPIGRHHINVFTRSEERLFIIMTVSPPNIREIRGAAPSYFTNSTVLKTMKLRFLVTSAAQGVFCKETP